MTSEGIAGDVQRDLRYHGGPERGLLLLDRIADLQRRIQSPGHRWRESHNPVDWILVGTRAASLTRRHTLRVAMRKIRHSFKDEDFRDFAKVHPGWSRIYAGHDRSGLEIPCGCGDVLPPGLPP